MKALVVFHDHGAGRLARLLKRGFRHVYVAVQDEYGWIALDGKAGIPEIGYVAPKDHDLAAFYRSHGFTVVEIEQRTRPPRAPVMWRNCVGEVKAVLAIRSWAVTPYQLFKHLRKADVQTAR